MSLKKARVTINTKEGEKERTVEDALDVDGHHIVPSLLFREVMSGSAPCHTAIIHKYVKLRLSLLNLGDEGFATSFALNGSD